MVNEEKIKLMTDISLDEIKRYPEEIREGGYFKGSYIRSHVISAIWNITIAYFLMVGLVALYRADYLLVNITTLSYRLLLGVFFGIYFLLVLITCLISVYYYSLKYYDNIAILKAYDEKLEQLKQFYTEMGEETEDDTASSV